MTRQFAIVLLGPAYPSSQRYLSKLYGYFGIGCDMKEATDDLVLRIGTVMGYRLCVEPEVVAAMSMNATVSSEEGIMRMTVLPWNDMNTLQVMRYIVVDLSCVSHAMQFPSMIKHMHPNVREHLEVQMLMDCGGAL